MKHRSIIAAVLVTVCAVATSAAEMPNAVVADPKHYTVEFENDAIRVVRIKYGPGEASVMHSHDANCAIFLRSGSTRMELPDGTSSTASSEPGVVDCRDAGVHLPSNVGDTASELVLVEMKGRKTVK